MTRTTSHFDSRRAAAASRGASPARSVLEALERPLRFAAEDDVAGVRVRDLEESIRQACRRGLALAIPRDLRAALEAVEQRFAEPLPAGRRSVAARWALERLAPFFAPGFPERALARPVTALPRVGPQRADTLMRRGLARVADVLFHLPARYEDRRQLGRVGELEVGRRATFVAEVQLIERAFMRGRGGRPRRILQVVVGDETGHVQLKWFRGFDALEGWLRKGARIQVTGDVRRYRFSKQLVHPEVELLAGGASEAGAGETPTAAVAPAEDLGALRRVVPHYSTPEGLNPRTFRNLIASAVAEYADLVEGHLPPALVRARCLPGAAEALRAVHDPEVASDLDEYAERRSLAHERLALEELYLLELGLALRRAAHAAQAGTSLRAGVERVRPVRESLPFTLTAAQERAWREIAGDLSRPHPMNRLLQGDVGSGKTAVAYLAAMVARAAGHQSALMAPTELLAEQHARTLAALACKAPPGLQPRIALLTSSLARPEAEAVKRALATGELDMAVGTHALLQESVTFHSLGLAIVDEQHRFGVLQRRALAEKGAGGLPPHVLVMTATPIPRTLSLTLYGDLDVSVIDKLPPGRTPAETLLLRSGEGRRIVELVRETTSRGEQVYVVYPLVEESEKLDLRSASESAERIRRAFPDLRVDLVHGRLDAADRAEAMKRFERGETHILVSTTVIEVGVDVHNATLMVIEHAERFGLAQLHQLRGRVGRGARRGICVLVSRGASEEGEARLRAMLATTDGFRIAEEDLRIRGPGEFLGTRQHGHLPDLRVADLVRDARWIAAAREAALAAVRQDPGLVHAPALRRAVEARWGERLALVHVG